MSSEPKFIITIGASAGGLNAISELVTQIPTDIDAAIFIVLHLSRRGLGDFLCGRLQRYTDIPCKVPKDNTPIEKRKIYVGPTDCHLLIKDNMIKIGNGPAENRWRLSINVLFRSAAAYHGERVIGVVLTGLLDDGTAGMLAIKNAGGTSMVQDPNEAEYPEMPFSVLNSMEVDYNLPLSLMGETLADIVKHKKIENKPIPEQIIKEAQIAERAAISIQDVSQLGKKSLYSCPDCGGGLWEITDEKKPRYRCHIGHAFSQQDLVKRQSEEMEKTLWVALRMMEERRNLLMKISTEVTDKGLVNLAQTHAERAKDLEEHIERLKNLLFASQDD